MATATIDTPLKWHGGKHYFAKRILELAPPRVQKPNAPEPDDPGYCHYVEPFAGGLAVLLANDPEGISEVVTDANRELVNFWEVLSNEGDFAEMQRILVATPFCECAYARAAYQWWQSESRSDTAARFFIRCRQSMSGRMKGFAPLTRNRTRRGMNEQASAWMNAVDGLPEVHARLRRVVILNRDALEVIRKQDGKRTWFYCDPPYLHDTRATTGEYAHEMTDAQHEELLETLAGIDGRFTLSGYPSDLYARAEKRHGWRRVDIDAPNNAAGGKSKRRMVECLWMNY